MASNARRPNLRNRLVKQLDTLIPFLGLSQDSVFSLLHDHESTWFTGEQRKAVPQSFRTFETQIAHGAFLLGYSYSEAFLSDLVRRIYDSRPSMLPEDSGLKFSDISRFRSYKAVVRFLVEKEVTKLFYKGMGKVVDYFEAKLCLKWEAEQRQQAVVASLVRNCIIHNGAVADSRLAEVSRYSVDEKIRLNSSEVHDFGIMMRGLADSLWRQARERHFRSRK